MSLLIDRATIIAHTAHAGQKRADNFTPYITHPYAVAALVREWAPKMHLTHEETATAVAVALLHDVIEDTNITEADLRALGIDDGVIERVVLLTKLSSASADGNYYNRIFSGSMIAQIVKIADRCSNLDDAKAVVLKTGSVARWARYAVKTRALMWPHVSQTVLSREFESRLVALEEALDATSP